MVSETHQHAIAVSTFQEEERNGIRFPADLDTPYAVAQVLNQQPGKLRTKDIREAAAAKKKVQKKMTRQMKVGEGDMHSRRAHQHQPNFQTYQDGHRHTRMRVKAYARQVPVVISFAGSHV